MRLKYKTLLSKFTFIIMIATIAVILVWFFGFILTVTFNLTVFNNKTSSFLFSLLAGAFVLVACSAILNISLNIGIIADSKLRELSVDEITVNRKKIVLAFASIVFFISLVLFGGDYLSRRQVRQKLLDESNDIINRYKSSIASITGSLRSHRESEIPNILKFLSNLKEEFPTVILVTTGSYHGEIAYLEITPWTAPGNFNKPYYDYSFYKCNRDDCSYLDKVFADGFSEHHLWNRDDEYKLYVPFISKDVKFVLIFSKYDRYGKIGS